MKNGYCTAMWNRKDHCCCSVAQSCLTFCDPMDCSCPDFPVLHISQSWLKLMSTELVMLFNHLIFYCPLLLLPSIFPSIRVISYELALYISGPKYGSFSLSPPNEYSGLISFRMDLFDLLAVQGTLKSLLQHHSLKASILQHSFFFLVQLSHRTWFIHDYWKSLLMQETQEMRVQFLGQ